MTNSPPSNGSDERPIRDERPSLGGEPERPVAIPQPRYGDIPQQPGGSSSAQYTYGAVPPQQPGQLPSAHGWQRASGASTAVNGATRKHIILGAVAALVATLLVVASFVGFASTREGANSTTAGKSGTGNSAGLGDPGDPYGNLDHLYDDLDDRYEDLDGDLDDRYEDLYGDLDDPYDDTGESASAYDELLRLMVREGVKSLQEKTTLPMKIDSVTTWIGITADGKEIRFDYRVDSSVDPSRVNEDVIRSKVGPDVCSASGTRGLVDAGVSMRYVYTFDGSSEVVDTVITKADCPTA